jgi:hypothetical protein
MFKGAIRMNRKVILLHRLFIAANILMLGASLVYYLVMWNTLPPEIGVHFDGDGNYNVTDSKLYGFYPHAVGGIITAGIVLAGRLIQKRSTGLRLTEKGETLFRGTIVLGLAVEGFLITMVFAYYWARSVEQQIPLPVQSELKGVLIAAFFVPLTVLILLIAIGIIFRDKAKKE